MDIAALLMWVVTALGGFSMLGVWIKRGGPQGGSSSRLPVPVVFGHFGLAAAGLVVWIVYVITDKDALAWTAFGLLVPVALLGFTMLARWIPVYQARATTCGSRPAGARCTRRALLSGSRGRRTRPVGRDHCRPRPAHRARYRRQLR